MGVVWGLQHTRVRVLALSHWLLCGLTFPFCTLCCYVISCHRATVCVVDIEHAECHCHFLNSLVYLRGKYTQLKLLSSCSFFALLLPTPVSISCLCLCQWFTPGSHEMFQVPGCVDLWRSIMVTSHWICVLQSQETTWLHVQVFLSSLWFWDHSDAVQIPSPPHSGLCLCGLGPSL